MQAESLYGMYDRLAAQQPPHAAIDPGVLDAGTWALIELNASDREAVYHYVAFLVRKVTGCHETVLRSCDPEPKPEVPEQRPPQGAARVPFRIHCKTPTQPFKVLMVDELLLFDASHYSATASSCGDGANMKDVGVIRDADPFVCLGEPLLVTGFLG